MERLQLCERLREIASADCVLNESLRRVLMEVADAVERGTEDYLADDLFVNAPNWRRHKRIPSW